MLTCEKLLDINEFKTIYTPFDINIERNQCVQDKCWYLDTNIEQKLVRYKIITKDLPPVSVLGNECCAENRFYKTPNEGIVSIESINLHPNIRGKKNMKKFLHSGDQIYRAHGYKMIVLKAIKDGIVAWHRMGFDYFRDADRMKIFNEFRKYYKAMNGVACPHKSLKEAKSEDFHNVNQTFSDWLNDKGFYGIRMLRRIPDAN